MKFDAKNFSFVCKLINECSPQYLWLRIFNAILQVAISFITVIFPKLIIDAIVSDEGYPAILQAVILMCLLLLPLRMTKSVVETHVEKLGGIVQFKLAKLYGDKVMRLRYEDLESPEILDLFEKSKKGFDLYGFFDKLFSAFTSFLTVLAYAGILLTYSWIVIPLILIIVFVNVFCHYKKTANYYQMNEAVAPLNRRFAYLSGLMLGFDYIKEIKTHQIGAFIDKKYAQTICKFETKLNGVYKSFYQYNLLVVLSSLFQTLALYVLVSLSAAKGEISIGDFSMYIASISAISASMIGMVTSAIDILQNMKYAADMRRFFDLETNFDAAQGERHPDKQIQSIEFKNVSFHYPRNDKNTISNMSFMITQGEKISIVGMNGAGKSTIIKLLLRLYEPTEGEILVNGININSYQYEEYLKLFAPVLQDYKIFAFSIKDNITFNEIFDKKRIENALRQSGISDKVKGLPNGYDTSLFKYFDENGIELSGGENQKVAIARAVYKDTPVVLLDEPTSNLDPLAEYDIYKAMFDSFDGKTCFFISHRLASCKFSSRILVINNGRIIADGNHDLLMQECDLYRDMFEKQSEFYMG